MDCQKQLFSLPDDHHYLNCAYMSPLLKTVAEAGKEGINRKQQPWNIEPEHFFRDTRHLKSLFSKLVNAPSPQQIAILPSVSYGISTVAANLPRNTDKKIIVAGEQFPSNIYPWMRICEDGGTQLQTVEAPSPSPSPAGRGRAWNERILEAIGADTLIVAVPHVHWTDGTLFDLKAIGRRAREAGALLVVDGTQSVGALPFDIQKIKPDALICAGYKWLMGPYSLALGYFGERFREGSPLEEGWLEREGSEDFSSLVNYTDQYKSGATRFDVGEKSNFILVPMLARALEQLLKWKPAGIQNYCKQLGRDFTTELNNLGYAIEESAYRSHHLFGLRLPAEIDRRELQERLRKHNIHVSLRGSALRISPHVYNNAADLTALLNVVREIKP